MVRFEKDKLVIEYTSGCNAVEEWIGLQEELVYVFSIMNSNNVPKDGLWRLANLMEAMVPDFDTATKMLNN